MSTRILIAESDATTRGLLAGWLEEAGYECLPSTPHEALADAARHRPDAALVSVDAHDDERMRIAGTLASRPDAAAVIVVSQPSLPIALEAARLGAADCLPWPTSAQGVVESVHRAVHRRGSRLASRQTHAGLRAAITHGVEELTLIVAGAKAGTAQVDLLTLLELRSRETFEHAQRVASGTAALARWLDLPPQLAADVRLAGLLHDIGKIAIPNELLLNASPLDDEEMTMLRMHVSIGAEVLSCVPSLRPLAALVAATHERFDGAGYPMRLRGGDIPLGARVIAVADVYDALTSSRAYHDPLTHDEANLELARVAGSQLDPEVVRAWIRMTESQRCS